MFVGNDIVAYKHTRCLNKSNDIHFLQKILQPLEIESLHLQINKDAFLWTLWTIKEATYKLSCFLGNRQKFHPLQFLVTNTEIIDDDEVQHFNFPLNNINAPYTHTYKAIVHFENQLFYSKTLITHQFIHSLVIPQNTNWETITWAIGEHENYNKNDYSNEVRAFTKHELIAQHKAVINFEKDKDGIPFVHFATTEKYISLSHDQQFVSFGFVSE
jgi:phosphopantetheinyl transferase (holo-ACP synthase)